MKVTLICHTANPETIVASAAKLCYSGSSIEKILEKNSNETANEFIEMLAEKGHESPLEHVSFTFGIEGVSRALLAQLTRHRIASFSVQSQRYVVEDDFSYVIPPEIESTEEAKEIFLKSMEKSKSDYCALLKILKQKHFNNLTKTGINEKIAEKMAEKKAAQDARFVLPNACATKLIVTMNARSLINFFKLRCCNRAQWEIRKLAFEILKIVKSVVPAIFKYAGPNCARGYCTEGSYSCGKVKNLK